MTAGQYIALLRAVNVGGRTVTMDRLRALFDEIGLAGARTYIQTGNVFFSASAPDRLRLARRIETHLSAALGFEVPAFIRSLDELEAIARADVFKGLQPKEHERICVIFTSRAVPSDFSGSHTAREDFDVLKVTPGELFVVWRFINGRPGNPGAFVEKAFDVKTTSRFFHTLEKMSAAGRAGAGGAMSSSSAPAIRR